MPTPHFFDLLFELGLLLATNLIEESAIDLQKVETAVIKIEQSIEVLVESSEQFGNNCTDLIQFESIRMVLLEFLPKLHMFGTGHQHATPKGGKSLVKLVKSFEG